MFIKIMAGTIGAILGAAVGLAVGLFIGAFIGGNFLQDFVFYGARGYEAIGQIGTIVGVVLGVVCGIIFALKIVRNRRNKKSWQLIIVKLNGALQGSIKYILCRQKCGDGQLSIEDRNKLEYNNSN